VPLHGAAQAAAHGDADPPPPARARSGEGDDRAPGEHPLGAHHPIEVLSAPEPEAPLHGPSLALRPLPRGELAAALPPAVLDDPPAPGRVHAPEEAVDAPAIPLLRLIRALDGRPL